MRFIIGYLLSFWIYSMAHAEINLIELNGTAIPWTDLKGKWLMINYWASWCQPCLDEINELNAFYYRNHDRVQLYAVNYDGLSINQQKKLIREYQITYPSLRDDPAKTLALGDLVGVPATFIFNPEGHWVKTLYGAQTADSLNQAIQMKQPTRP